MSRSRATIALCLLLLAGASLTGCMSRRLHITSTPPGASVAINDVDVGRTPLEVDFTYYASYDVLLTLDGYEPLRTKAKAKAPIYEYPPLDLPASMTGVHTDVRWHFDLQPLPERTLPREQFERELLERAQGLRGTLSQE